MAIIKKSLYYLSLFFILMIFIGPILWMIVLAFHPMAGIFTEFALFKPTLKNFTSIVHKGLFLKAFINSTIISISATILALVLSFPVSYTLARFNFKGKKDLGYWFLSGRMIPPVAVIIPFIIVFQRLKLIDTKLGLILVYLLPCMAFSVLILVPFIKSIPEAMEEAAKVDGCTRIGILFRIVLPISRHGIIVSAVFSMITCWNEFFFAFVLTRQQVRTLPVLVQSYLTFSSVKWGEMMATSIVIVLPLILFVFLIQDYLVTGLTMGAIKE